MRAFVAYRSSWSHGTTILGVARSVSLAEKIITDHYDLVNPADNEFLRLHGMKRHELKRDKSRRGFSAPQFQYHINEYALL